MIPISNSYYLQYSYFFRYKEKRKQVKNLIDLNQFSEAVTQLDSAITEQSNFYTDAVMDQRRDFNYGEKINMIQARNHIQEALIDENNPDLYFVNQTTGEVTLGKHSDKVKQILEYQPKNDYRDVD